MLIFKIKHFHQPRTLLSFAITLQKNIVFIYMMSILSLDLIMGYMLKYKNFSHMLINPGQAVRTIVLIILIGNLIVRSGLKLSKLKLNIYLAIIFYVIFLLNILFQHNFKVADDVSSGSKILFFLLLIEFICYYCGYFTKRLDKIIKVNFCIFTANFVVSYFFNIGFKQYSYIENSYRGFFYGGNITSLFSIIFFTYFLYQLKDSKKNWLYLSFSLFNIHLISSKTALLIPITILIYLYYRNIQICRNPLKKYATLFLLIIFSMSTIVVCLVSRDSILDMIPDRHLSSVKRSYNAYMKKGPSINNILTVPLQIIAYRRPMAAKEQIQYMNSHPDVYMTGMGKIGQTSFWVQKNSIYHDASMDFFDILFVYGLLGATLIYYPIVRAILRIFNNKSMDAISCLILIIFAYSFFGGHVMTGISGNNFFALFIGLNLFKDKEFSKNKLCEF